MDFPYQLTVFLAKEPHTNEPVYGGENGWYPQVALKRRFVIKDMTEQELFEKIEQYCAALKSFVIQTGETYKPDRMPVSVISVAESPDLMNFHNGFIVTMGERMVSRFPERDGANYLPHVTVEYGGKMVVDPAEFTDRRFIVTKIWLLKDIETEDSIAYKKFQLGTV